MKAVLLLCFLLLSLPSSATTLKDKLSSAETARAIHIYKDSFIQAFMRAEGMVTAEQLVDTDDMDDMRHS
jgi:hypothetical protein